MNSTQEQYQSDEIDLRELLSNLWGRRLLVLAITAIFSSIGVIYAFLAPQVWTAKTIVVAPLPTQLEQLHFRLEKVFALMDSGSVKHGELRAAFSGTKLYTDFIQAFDSFDNKSEFLKENVYFRQEGQQDVNTLQQSFEGWTKNIAATQNINEASATLSYSADNAQEAEKLLIDYLNFIQTKEDAAKNKLLADKVINQIDVLTFNHQILEAETHKQLQEEIARTEYALRISQTAGIDAPVENLNNQGIFIIDFGAKALSEQLNILKEIKNPQLINPSLANFRLKLDSLRAVPQEKVSFASYHFLKSPSQPLDRDKPKRSLVVVLATLGGLMTGVTVALSHASWFSRDAAKQTVQSTHENKEMGAGILVGEFSSEPRVH
jgi:LPS O-antigen subunit length determinant protein (WzzB/FepE family)